MFMQRIEDWQGAPKEGEGNLCTIGTILSWPWTAGCPEKFTGTCCLGFFQQLTSRYVTYVSYVRFLVSLRFAFPDYFKSNYSRGTRFQVLGLNFWQWWLTDGPENDDWFLLWTQADERMEAAARQSRNQQMKNPMEPLLIKLAMEFSDSQDLSDRLYKLYQVCTKPSRISGDTFKLVFRLWLSRLIDGFSIMHAWMHSTYIYLLNMRHWVRGMNLCVCVCVCARARVRVCVCTRVCWQKEWHWRHPWFILVSYKLTPTLITSGIVSTPEKLMTSGVVDINDLRNSRFILEYRRH